MGAPVHFGFPGSIDSVALAKWIHHVGQSRYGVADAASWEVKTLTGVDRAVSVLAGIGWGDGVMTKTDVSTTVTFPSVSSGSKWFMVVARRNWSSPASVTYTYLTGGATASVLPMEEESGVLADQPLALCRVDANSAVVAQIIDLRVFVGEGGGLYAKSELVMGYMTSPGAQILIGESQWQCKLDSQNNPVWKKLSVADRIPLWGMTKSLDSQSQTLPPVGISYLTQAGSTVNISDIQGYAKVTWPVPFPSGLLTVIAVNGDELAVPGGVVAGSGQAGFGTAGYGDKNGWWYSLLAPQNGSLSRLPSKNHRINWIAIGW